MASVIAVVLNFRTPSKTLACLRSIIKEGVIHVVLVENSGDAGASLSAMQDVLISLCDDGVTIDVLDEGRNLGFSAGVNRALAHILSREQAQTDVLLLNSDARMLPGSLLSLCEALALGAEVAAPMLISGDGSMHRPLAYYQRHTGLLTRRRLPGSLPFITGACILLSRKVLVRDLFDEDFFFYGEDVMLSEKMRLAGRKSVVAESARVLHEGAGSARNGSLFYEYHINRGHWLLAGKLNNSGFWYRIALIGRGVCLSIRALVRMARTGSAVPLLAFIKASEAAMSGQRHSVKRSN